MPAFKIMDLLAAMTELGATLSHETQLRSQEVDIILRETLSDTAPIIRQFLLEAALECARYEPMMVNDETAETRFEILNRRWQAMYTAHQSQSKLDHPRLAHVQQAVTNAIHSPDFAHYRTGPMLQLFSEMLATAREHQLENKPISELETALSSNNALWRRYALKSKRYQQKSVGGTGLIHPESRTLH